MRVFWMTLLVSIVASITLWNLGLAHKIWPTHPFLATVIVAAIIGIAVQLTWDRDKATLGK
ncbi:MAG: hypothetical protein JO159_00405 [Acidobacteria bacterium]|nr:hypothetical protein [Acidobacteriota bacterium]MBV9623078.1 hypothetical protein [Acidobacteriota bacterium]